MAPLRIAHQARSNDLAADPRGGELGDNDNEEDH
jgi:hypothetical protein